MSKRELKFGERVTMDELNQHNFAIKNEYITNTITTALNILPIANRIVGSDNIKVYKCFLSKRYILDELNIPSDRIHDVLKHGEGLAIEIGWEDFDTDEAVSLARVILDDSLNGDNYEPVKIVIDSLKNRINFYYNVVKESEILEYTTTGFRLIYKQ